MQSRERYNQCWALIRAQQFSNASRIAQQLCELHPKQVETWHTLSVAARGNRDSQLALFAIEKALGLAPCNAELKAYKCLCLLSAGKNNEAIELAKSMFIQEDAETSYILNTLLIVFQSTDEFELQRDVAKRALAVEPENTVTLANYAETLRHLGDFEQASHYYDQLISLAPESYSAYWGRSQCKKASLQHNHLASLEQLLTKNTLPWRAQMQLQYARFKEYEDIELYSKAFSALEKGAALRREHLQYDVESDVQTMQTIAKHYSVIAKMEAQPLASTPIFVVGLPRSGTTLVERILGSHSAVKDAGELPCFPVEMVKQIRKNNPGKHLDKMANVAASTQLNWPELGKAYIESTQYRTQHAKYFIDKLPLNYLYLGLIAQALPNAKIILLQRNPIDSCFAMYKTLFAEAYPFSYDLQDLSAYYIAWKQLMDHWQSVMPDRIFVQQYETLVTDTESSVRSLLSYCQLPFEEDCLTFYQRKSGVSTASAAQVRQPMYQSSINKWKHYHDQLIPLKTQLVNAGINV